MEWVRASVDQTIYENCYWKFYVNRGPFRTAVGFASDRIDRITDNLEILKQVCRDEATAELYR